MLLRAVTYNVHKCRGLDGRADEKRIAAVLREVNPSVAALQEVLEPQAEYFSAELGMHSAFGVTRIYRRHAYGNLVLSRLPVLAARAYDLSVGGREERGCLRADLQLESSALLHIFNVHLGTALIERRHQGRELVSPRLLNDIEIQAPRLVLGDFNEWTRGLATRLLRSQLRSADVRLYLKHSRTYPGLLPLLHLDHIYYDPALRLRGLTLHRTPKALIASDHLPLVADFAVMEGVQKEKGSK